MDTTAARPRARRRILRAWLISGLASTAANAQVASVELFPIAPPPQRFSQISIPVDHDRARRTDRYADDVDATSLSRSADIAIAGPPAAGPGGANCRGNAPLAPRALSLKTSIGRRLFWNAVTQAECRFGLPAGLMDSLILAESGYDARALSPTGAAGLAQLMPAAALRLGVVDRLDPVANISAGAHYLRLLLDGFAGNIPLALAAYNAGPGVVRRVRGIPANGETPAYVRRVLNYWTAPGIGPMSAAMSARETAQFLGFGPTQAN